jgi:pantoate--beta-alanine ligase
MIIVRTNAALISVLDTARQQGKRIGFVPTMGALHPGHLSLLKSAQQLTDFTVCSIFVNPTQFNDPSDLINYPRTEEQDCSYLKAANCDVVYLPSVDEIYPSNWEAPVFDFGELALVMEGEHRPGHFKGMSQVVFRLLQLVQPNALFMGQKDLQQFAIVRRMLRLMNSKIELICCPIIREVDGLAMSSRNVRLTAEERSLAPTLFQFLKILQAPNLSLHYTTPNDYLQYVELQLKTIPVIQLEYLQIVAVESLQDITHWTDAKEKAACIAVKLGKIRLIDNVLFN